MNTKTIRELRNIAKDKGLGVCYNRKKADLFTLLLEQSTKVPAPPPKSSIKWSHDKKTGKTLKGDLECDVKKENQKEKGIDSAPHKDERALKGAYRSFVIPLSPKTGIDNYFDQIKSQIKNQLKDMGSAKIIMSL